MANINGAENIGFPRVNYAQASMLIRAHFKAGIPMGLFGSPGLGKTELCDQQSRDVYGVAPHYFVASQRQHHEVGGIMMPDLQAGTSRILKPDPANMPQEYPGCIIFDDVTGALPIMQVSILQLAGPQAEAGAYKLPRGPNGELCGRLFTGNRPQDRAAAARVITPLRDRMDCYELTPDLNQWAAASLKAGVSPEIVGYIRFWSMTNASGEHMTALNDWDASRDWNTTPRGWWDVDRLLKGGPNPPEGVKDEREPLPVSIRELAVAGRIGKDHASGLESFFKLWGQIPDPDAIILDPKHAPVPYKAGDTDSIGLMFAVCGALAQRCKQGTGSRIMQYAERLPEEFSLCLIRDAQNVNAPALCNTPEFMTWVTTHQDLYD